MAAQDCLYTLVVKHSDGSLPASGDRLDCAVPVRAGRSGGGHREAGRQKQTRIVSLTVIQGGYNFHAVTGEFDASNPDVRARRRARQPFQGPFSGWSLRPWSVGARAIWPPFTVCPSTKCFKRLVIAARRFRFGRSPHLRDPELGAWVQQPHFRFENSMVDRITPVTTDEDKAELQPAVRDRRSVAGGLRALRLMGTGRRTSVTVARHGRDAGVQLVQRRRPCPLMKLRLLNASHQALCLLRGISPGYRLVHEVCQDALFSTFPARVHRSREEATPTLPFPLPRNRRGGLQAEPDHPLFQPKCRRHRSAAVRGELRPNPEMAPAGHPAQPGHGRRDKPRDRPRWWPVGHVTQKG